MADDHRDIREPLACYLKKQDELRVTKADGGRHVAAAAVVFIRVGQHGTVQLKRRVRVNS